MPIKKRQGVKAIKKVHKKSVKNASAKRGRPATGKDPLISSRLPKWLIEFIEQWTHLHGVSRSEAVRTLLYQGLKADEHFKWRIMVAEQTRNRV